MVWNILVNLGLRDHDRHEDTADLTVLLLILCRKDKGCPLAVKELHHELSAADVREDLDEVWRLETDCKRSAVILACECLVCCDRESKVLSRYRELFVLELKLDVVGCLV